MSSSLQIFKGKHLLKKNHNVINYLSVLHMYEIFNLLNMFFDTSKLKKWHAS